jgi:hypothetical protein
MCVCSMKMESILIDLNVYALCRWNQFFLYTLKLHNLVLLMVVNGLEGENNAMQTAFRHKNKALRCRFLASGKADEHPSALFSPFPEIYKAEYKAAGVSDMYSLGGRRLQNPGIKRGLFWQLLQRAFTFRQARHTVGLLLRSAFFTS